MSGLEVLGALVSIGEIVQKTRSCYDQLQKLQRAPQELKELIGQLAAAEAIFAAAQRQLKALQIADPDNGGGNSTNSDAFAAAVAELGMRANTKVVEVHDLIKRNSQQKRNSIRVKRLKWVLGTERITQLKAELATIRDEFVVALEVGNSQSGTKTHSKLDHLTGLSDAIIENGRRHFTALTFQEVALKTLCQALEDHNAMYKRVEEIVEGFDQFQIGTAKASATETTETAETAVPETAIGDSDPPPAYSTVTQELTVLKPRRKSSDTPMPTATVLPRPSSYRTLHQCKASCDCICHRRRRLTTPRFLQSFTGSWSVTVSGWNYVSATCDSPKTCKRSQDANTQVTYVFPNWFAAKAVSLYTHCSPLGEPGMQLKTRRVIMTDAFRLAQTGDVEGLHNLYQRGEASPHDLNPQEGQSALLTAVWCGQAEIVRYLFSRDVITEEQTFDGLETTDAVIRHVYGKVSSPQTVGLMAHLFNVEDLREEQQFTIIHKIVLGLADSKDLEKECSEHPRLVDTTDLRGRSPLWWAALRQDVRSCRILLEHNASPNNADYQGETVMQNAAGTVSTQIVKLLLDHKANIGSGSGVSESALHYAARFDSRIDTVRLLLDHDADPNSANRNGITPLHEAIEPDAIEVARLLCKYQINITARDHLGDTYLHMAIRCRASRILRLLIAKGCDLTATGAHGRTILHAVAKAGDESTIEVLKEASLLGVDADALDDYGRSASDYIEVEVAQYAAADADYAFDIRKSLLALLQSARNGNETAEPPAGLASAKEDAAKLSRTINMASNIEDPVP